MRLRAGRGCAACLIWALPSLDVVASGAGEYELVFSTHVGGKSWQHARDVCTDKDGNVYMVGGKDEDGADGIYVDKTGNVFFTGHTRSRDFRTTPGAFQATPGGRQEAAPLSAVAGGACRTDDPAVGGLLL